MIDTNIKKAAQLLKEGEVVGVPTETVYGLAASIYQEEAIRSIFRIKKRPLDNPLIVHIADFDQLEELVLSVPPKAKVLMEKFWPGPLTLLLPKSSRVPDLVTASKPTVAIRMPSSTITRELISQVGEPIAAPSANPFSRISPTTAAHVEMYFSGELKMVLDGGPCSSGIESTIVGFDQEDPIIYRLGALSLEDIENVVGPVSIRNKKEEQPDAPGMMFRHYSPNTPTLLCSDIREELERINQNRIGVITLGPESFDQKVVHIVLSESSNLEEAASRLYESMHLLDQSELDMILIQRMPEEGLGISMNDRLLRASNI
jgi:L-threonylcarbamoyladenylate synthase